MAKGKIVDEQADGLDTAEEQPTPSGVVPNRPAKTKEADGLVTVVAVGAVYRRAENRTYAPGEMVLVEPETAALLVELGVARLAEGTV